MLYQGVEYDYDGDDVLVKGKKVGTYNKKDKDIDFIGEYQLTHDEKIKAEDEDDEEVHFTNKKVRGAKKKEAAASKKKKKPEGGAAPKKKLPDDLRRIIHEGRAYYYSSKTKDVYYKKKDGSQGKVGKWDGGVKFISKEWEDFHKKRPKR